MGVSLCSDDFSIRLLWLSMMLRLKIFLSLLSFAKCLSIKPRNLRPMLVLTFLLNGGLYQRMSFRCLFFRLAGAVGS